MGRVVGLGAGGHAKVVIELLRLLGGHDLVGVLDPRAELHGSDLLGVPVLGGDELLSGLREDGVGAAFVGVGTAKGTAIRRRLYGLILAEGLRPVAAVHPQALVAGSAVVGEGPTIMAGAIVGTCALLGANVLVNSGAIVEHDCRLGDHVHVASGARLAGGVIVHEGAHVGLGASVRQGCTIGREAVVGAGAVVVDDVPDDVVVVGVPARVVAG